MISTGFRFLKRNWKEVLIVVCLLMVMGKMRADYNRLEEVHETMRTSLQDQITGLQEIHDEELRQRDAALRTYKEELEKLQRNYEVNLETIRSERESKLLFCFSAIENGRIDCRQSRSQAMGRASDKVGGLFQSRREERV